MRGIISWGAHVPYRRLDCSTIPEFFGSGGGRTSRSVASFDEDTTSMAVEAARPAMRRGIAAPDQLWFVTTDPAYMDRTNATAVHAALRLPESTIAMDMIGSSRTAAGVLRNACEGRGTTAVVGSDIRVGLPTSPDEAAGGDAAACVIIGDDSAEAPVVARLVGSGVATREFVDRWRIPGEPQTRTWDERFSENVYRPLVATAFSAACADAGVQSDEIDRAAVSCWSARVAKRAKLGAPDGATVPPLEGVGWTGAADPMLLLQVMLDHAQPDELLALVVMADGVDVQIYRTTDAIVTNRPLRSVAEQAAITGDVPYAKFLSWRGLIAKDPPRRPMPARTSAVAAARVTDWKFGLVGSQDSGTGDVYLPPSRRSIGESEAAMVEIPMADAEGTIVTFTVDKLAWSPSPPIVFAVVDFDGGGRMPIELTDVDPDDVSIGDRIELTFRCLSETDGIANYFWKGRPVRREQHHGE